MGRRSKKEMRHEQFKEGLRKDVIEAVQHRMQVLAPFPYPATEVYSWMFTPEEIMYLERVRLRHANIFRTNRQLVLHVPAPNGAAVVRITMELEEARPMSPDMVITPPLECVGKLQDWCVTFRDLRQDVNRVNAAMELIGKVSKTYGHAVRLWPEPIGFLPEAQQIAVRTAKARSPYPDGACYDHSWVGGVWTQHERRLFPDYAPEKFEPLNSLLAEAIMLADADKPEGLPLAAHNWYE